MTTLPATTSGLRWKEGTEGLQFGELFLGGVASIYLGRGRSSGYGLYFTDQRVIGVRMPLITQALLAPYLIVISSLYLLLFFELGSREYYSSFSPLSSFWPTRLSGFYREDSRRESSQGKESMSPG